MKYIKIALSFALLSALLTCVLLYRSATRVPSHVVIAAGPAGGNYFQLSHALSNKINAKLTRQRNDRQIRLLL